MKPHILVSNDDGIASPGLRSLVDALPPDRFALTVVAPEHPQSARGCAHSHGDKWVRWSKTTMGEVDWISVGDTPATCVSVALRVCEVKPDLVISGINFGENLGLNLFYSGTIGAAWEAAMSGVPALAVSLELPPNLHFTHDKSVSFEVAGHFAVRTAEKILRERPPTLLWNLNVPTAATLDSSIREARVAQNRWNYPIPRETRGNNVSSGEVRFEFDPTGEVFGPESDVTLLRQGYVTLTALNHLTFPWAE